MSTKPFYESKKWLLSALGIVAVIVLALTGNGDSSAYGTIGLIVSVACGVQGYSEIRSK